MLSEILSKLGLFDLLELLEFHTIHVTRLQVLLYLKSRQCACRVEVWRFL